MKELDTIQNIIKRTTVVYNSFAPAYFQCWSSDTRMQERIDKFLIFLRNQPIVADIGCGTGRDIKYLLSKGAQAAGIDISIAMLLEAKKIIPSGNLSLMNMMNLGFPSNAFDGVWAIASILHIPKSNFRTVFHEIIRIL